MGHLEFIISGLNKLHVINYIPHYVIFNRFGSYNEIVWNVYHYTHTNMYRLRLIPVSVYVDESMTVDVTLVRTLVILGGVAPAGT